MTAAPLPPVPRGALFGDTSFFYATLDRRDRDHPAAEALAQSVQERQIPLVTTWEVVVEPVPIFQAPTDGQSFVERALIV